MTSKWVDHPIVAYAIERADGAASPLQVAESLLEVMNDLEDKFPGVPFADILGMARRVDEPEVRETLEKLGVAVDPDEGYVYATEGHARYMEAFAEVARWADLGLSGKEMMDRGVVRIRANRIAGLRRPFAQPSYRSWAIRVVEGGEAIATVAEDVGANYATVKWAAYKLMYHRRMEHREVAA